jgi:dihydroorotase-like cyclic amidohydrolase
MVVDTVIKNCKVVHPLGIREEGIAINREEIVALAADPCLPNARKTIDARGNYVIPGLIDPHVHLGLYQPANLDIRAGTISAALGGITSIGNYLPGTIYSDRGLTAEMFAEWKEIYERCAIVDAFFHGRVMSSADIGRLTETIRNHGIISYKFNMAYKGSEGAVIGIQNVDDGLLYEGFRAIAASGLPTRALVHAENIDIINRIRPGIQASGRQDLAAWTETRPDFCELLDAERAICLAQLLETPLYIVHISAAKTIRALYTAKKQDIDVVGETCPHYLTLTKNAPLGPLGKMNPALKCEEDIEALWHGIKEGVIECLGSDHCSPTRKMKQDLWTGVPGIPGIDCLLPLMLSEGVNRGRITLEKLVQVCCYNNAKTFGLHPQKGEICVGSDADLVIVDLTKKAVVAPKAESSLSDFSVYEGRELQGWPILTMLRGNVIMEQGRLVGKTGIGRYLRSQL